MEKAKKITMELGNNEEVSKVTPEFTKKSEEWLKKFPTVPEDSKLQTEKIDEVKTELDKVYDNQPPQSLNRLKGPNIFKMSEKKKKENFLSKAKGAFNKWGKRIALTIGLTAVSMGAKGEVKNAEKAFTDSTENKTEKVIGGMRKVKEGEVTKDYKLIREEGEKKTYARNLKGGRLEMAQSSTSKGGPEYEKKLISLLKSGISPKELADKKYISPEKIPEYEKYYVEYTDYVYTEPEKIASKKEVNPFAGYALSDEIIYDDNKHSAALIYHMMMNTKDQKDAGMLDTRKEDVLLDLIDGNGKRLNKIIGLSSDEFTRLTGTGKHISNEQLAKWIENKTYELTPEDIAKGTTLK